jgi:exodeoxyribonuclease VII large subunit
MAQKAARLIGGLDRALQAGRRRLEAAGARIPDLPGMLGNARMRLDDRAQRLSLALPNLLAARAGALLRLERHVPDPAMLIAARRHALSLLGLRLLAGLRATVQLHRDAANRVAPHLTAAGLQRRLAEQTGRLQVMAARLDGASYERVLARGFVLVRDAAGKAVTAAARVAPGARLKLVFGDGEVGVVSEGRQGRLF